MTEVGQEAASWARARRRRAVGIIVTAVLLVLDILWLCLDRDRPASPQAPTQYEALTAQGADAEPALPLLSESQAQAGYALSGPIDGLVGGRRALVYFLKSSEKHLPWRQLWVDPKTIKILALRDWTSTNKLKRSLRMRSSQNLKALVGEATWTLPSGRVASPGSSADGRRPEASKQMPLPEPPGVGWLPPGCGLVGVRHRPGG
ncbi:MAG: hypothetical protein ACP5R5_09735 [Armatimonadota bacterium]